MCVAYCLSLVPGQLWLEFRHSGSVSLMQRIAQSYKVFKQTVGNACCC